MTVSHDEKFSRVHSPSAVWVQSVTTRGFEVCARESGIGSNGTGIINWLAFQGHPQMTRGSVTFSGIWTTETKCDKINLSQVRWKKKRLRSTLRVFFVLSHALSRYFAEVVLQKLKWKMTLGARFDFFYLRLQLGQFHLTRVAKRFLLFLLKAVFIWLLSTKLTRTRSISVVNQGYQSC